MSEQCKPNLASGRAEYIIWSMKCKAGVLMIPRKEWGVQGGREEGGGSDSGLWGGGRVSGEGRLLSVSVSSSARSRDAT